MARLDSSEQKKMKAYTLEKAVDCLDKVLLEFSRLDYSSSKYFNTSITNDENANTTDTNQARLDALHYEKKRIENIRLKQLNSLAAQCNHLLPLLLSEMTKNYTEEKEKDSPIAKSNKGIKWSTTSGLTSYQLVLRGILGCIRVQIAAVKAGVISITDVDHDDDGPLEVYETVSSLLSHAFHIIDPTKFRDTINHGDDAVSQLTKFVRSFYTITLTFAKDSKNNRTECPVLMAIIGELVSVLPEAQDRSGAVAHILQKANDPNTNLIASAELSQAFLTFLIMKSPIDQRNRQTALLDATKVIYSCSKFFDDNNDDDDANDEDEDDNNKVKHVSYVTTTHYWNTVTFVVGMLEKVSSLIL